MTQNERIERHLSNFGTITASEAMSEYGIMRLSARIYELKKMGVRIEKETKTALNRFGEPVSFAKYRLVG